VNPAESTEREAAASRLQDDIYSRADGPIWRHAVYDLLHGGWDLASIGGRTFLEDLVRQAPISDATTVLDLGCGGGAACQYLAQRTGCAVTGLEKNPEQVQRARERARHVSPGAMRVWEGDIGQHEQSQEFDCVYQLDTFSLLPSAVISASAARRHVAKEGRFFMADLVAGPHCTSAVRDHAWRTDGFSSLETPDAWRTVLRDCGFEDITATDHTSEAVAANAAMLAWFESPPEAIRPELDRRELAAWRSSTQWYLSQFSAGTLGYCWWVMRVAL
jgi:cyclopropane fatty-acyl-phospholipid synthase-like methyltransferase